MAFEPLIRKRCKNKNPDQGSGFCALLTTNNHKTKIIKD